ncbi:hypothetical protein MASR1M65_19070 [Saprospiraceae bacterium]
MKQEVSFGLKEGRQTKVFIGVGHECGICCLNGCIGTENVELVYFAKLGGETGRCYAVAGFPACVVIGLAE